MGCRASVCSRVSAAREWPARLDVPGSGRQLKDGATLGSTEPAGRPPAADRCPRELRRPARHTRGHEASVVGADEVLDLGA
jgi:hypothetical protein